MSFEFVQKLLEYGNHFPPSLTVCFGQCRRLCSVPNITGTTSNTYLRANADALSGALYGTYGLEIVNGNASVGAIRNLSFDASRNNITYGKSSTVQAAAVQILIIIKV